MQEAVALEFYIGSVMTQLESNHQQYLLGYLGEEHWQRNIQEMKCMLDVPVSRQMLGGWDYRGSFQQLINEISEQVIRDPVGCWDVGWPYAVAE